MAKLKKVKIDIERINELLRIKKVIDSENMVDSYQWNFVKFNVWDFNGDEAVKYFGKSECESNCLDYDIEWDGKGKTEKEMKEHKIYRGACSLAQNECDIFGDYLRKGNAKDLDLLENLKDALRSAGYKEGLQIEGIEY